MSMKRIESKSQNHCFVCFYYIYLQIKCNLILARSTPFHLIGLKLSSQLLHTHMVKQFVICHKNQILSFNEKKTEALFLGKIEQP